MTNFWQDNVLADEFNAPSPPAVVMNWQSSDVSYPQDTNVFLVSGLSVTIDSSTPTYSVTFPIVNVTRSGAPTGNVVGYAALGPGTNGKNAYFDLTFVVKNSSGTTVSTVTQSAASWGSTVQISSSNNVQAYLFSFNQLTTWPPASVLPSGATGTMTFTMTLNTTLGNPMTSGTLLALIILA